MTSFSDRDAASSSLFSNGISAIVLAAVAVLLVNWNGAFPHTYSDLFERHLTVANAVFAAAFAVLWQICASAVGLHAYDHGAAMVSIVRVIECSLGMSALLALYAVVFVPGHSFLKIAGSFFVAAIVCEVLRMGFAKGFEGPPSRVVIVGSDRLAAKAWREFRTERKRRIELAGFVDDGHGGDLLPDIAVRYLGEIAALARIVVEQAIDVVVVATPMGAASHSTEQAVSLAGAMGARILCLKDISGLRPETIGRDYGDTLFELVPAPRLGGIAQATKRAFDVVSATLGLLTGLPVLCVALIAGFIQNRRFQPKVETRIGFRRKQYRMYGFCVGPGDGHLNLWLSYLPAMWNILRGEMSMVGPAPLSKEEIANADLAILAGRFNVRPGLTGCLEAGRSSEIPTLEPGIQSPSRWSLRTDLRVLARALRAVAERTSVARSGAGAL